MKTNKDYILRKIAAEAVLIPTGAASSRLNGMIHLTETAAFLWKAVDSSRDMDEIIRKMQEEYEIDQETAERDAYGFLIELYVRGMVEAIPERESFRLIDQLTASVLMIHYSCNMEKEAVDLLNNFLENHTK